MEFIEAEALQVDPIKQVVTTSKGDFTYDNFGVPRNIQIPKNQDTSFFDLGLCGPSNTTFKISNNFTEKACRWNSAREARAVSEFCCILK